MCTLYKLSFNTLPQKNDSVSIHYRNVRKVAIETYKYFHSFSSTVMDDVISINSHATYHLSSSKEIFGKNQKTVRYDTET